MDMIHSPVEVVRLISMRAILVGGWLLIPAPWQGWIPSNCSFFGVQGLRGFRQRHSNRMAFAGAIRDTYMLGTTSATTHTASTPMFNARMGPKERSTGTWST